MSWQIQESVNFGNGDSLWTVSNFYNVIARADFSLLQHAKVKPRSSMCYKQRRHTRLVHADADTVARDARLRYFKYCIANAVSIADAHLVIRKPFNSEVFAELAESKIIAAQKALPVMIGVHLVDKYGALFAAVTGQVGLRIPIEY